jgi:hypothetical protein
MPEHKMRRFELRRKVDVSGTSGVGLVVEGIEFSNGSVAFTWRSPYHSITTFNSVKAMMEVHGHGGATELVWIDT